MQAFERSGLTVTQFCGKERVSSATFYKWRERLGGEPSRPRVEFFEVGGGGDGGTVEVLVAAGVVVRVRGDFDPAALNRVLDVLAARR
jgi:hypothetical protein